MITLDKWVIGVGLIQLPLFIGFTCCFLPLHRFKRFPRMYKLLSTLQYFFPYLFLFACQSTLIWMELRLETHLNATYDWDYTPWMYQLEGDIVEHLQGAMLNPSLTPYFHFIYVVGFTTIINTSIIIYIALKHEKIVRTLAFGIIIMTSIALPFYIFFPVNEVWVSNPEYYNIYSDFSTNVVNILREVREGEAVTQVFSNVNNCFPSMHTAISVFIALTLIVNKRKYLAPIYTFVAASIVTATIYLGIHWITDIIAGLILASSITFLLYYLDFNFKFRMKYLKHYEFPFRIENATWRGQPINWKKKTVKPSRTTIKKSAEVHNFTKHTTKKGKLLLEGPNLLIRKIIYILVAIICMFFIIILNYLPFIPDAALRYMVYFLSMTLLLIGLIFSVQKTFFQRIRVYKNGLAPTQIPKKYWFSSKEYFIPFYDITEIEFDKDWIDLKIKSGDIARIYKKFSGVEIFDELKRILKELKKIKKETSNKSTKA